MGACFGVTAPEPLRPIAEALVVEMGSDPQWVEEEQRVLYHAALAGGANHLATLVNESVDLLRRFSHASATAPSFSREWGDDYFSRTATPALRIPDFNMSSVSQAM